MSAVERKYSGVITKADGTVVNDFIIFRAKDKCVVDTLIYYLGICIERKCEEEHIQAIHNLIARVRKYQKNNPEVVKLPDTKPEDIIIHALDIEEEELEKCPECGSKMETRWSGIACTNPQCNYTFCL